jgi:hypothetical protein
MTPSSFTFKVSVPNDPTLASIVGELAKHAADYARLDAGAAAAFMERAQAIAARVLTSGAGAASTAVIVAADGTLTVSMGDESASQPLSPV